MRLDWGTFNSREPPSNLYGYKGALSARKKERSSFWKSSLFLVRETGEEQKTVDNCFLRTKSKKQGAKGESESNDALRLCDLTGEPSIPESPLVTFMATRGLYPHEKKRGLPFGNPLFFWCGKRELNPYGKTTRPSNVRVCQFRHSRGNGMYYTLKNSICQYVFQKIFHFSLQIQLDKIRVRVYNEYNG